MIVLMKHTFAAITAILIFAGFAPVANADPHGRAVLQGLDKGKSVV